MRPLLTLPRSLFQTSTAGASPPSPSPGPGPSPGPSPGPTPTPTPTVGLWGPIYPYDHTVAGHNWRQLRRDRVTETKPGTADLDAYGNFGWPGRQQHPDYRPADGRIWFGVGNATTWGLTNVDGVKDVGSNSNSVTVFSFDPANPYDVCRETGWPVDDISRSYGQGINPWKGHDPVGDRWTYWAASSFGWEFDPVMPAPNTPLVISPVMFVSSTKARFAATTAQVPVNTKMRFLCTVGSETNCPCDARVTAVSDIGGGNVEVTFTVREPSLIAFQSPTSVIVSVLGTGHWLPQGAWQDGMASVPVYRESDGKWCVFLNTMDYATGVQGRAFFAMGSKTDAIGSAGGQVMTPASTGRGYELWLCTTNGEIWGKYDLSALTYTAYSGGGDALAAGGSNWGCGDNEGHLYLASAATLTFHTYDIRGAAPVQTVKNFSQPVFSVPPPGNIEFCYHMIWNEEIKRIEMYTCMEGTLGSGHVQIAIIDPSTNPVNVEEIITVDEAGKKIWTAMPVQIPGTLGSVPPKTLLMGGIGDGGSSGPNVPDGMRTFVAANRREWAELFPLAYRAQKFTNARPMLTDQETTIIDRPGALDAGGGGLFHASYASIVPIMGAGGNNTGDFMYMFGGDGDVGSNEVLTAFTSTIDSQNRFAVQSNTWTSDEDINVWHKRIRTPYQSGSFFFSEELVGNPANLAEWQPQSSHWGYVCAHHPTLGMLVDSWVPQDIGRNWTGAMTPYNRTVGHVWEDQNAHAGGPYPDNPDFSYWGVSRGNIGATHTGTNRGSVAGLSAWNRTGTNAGKWRRLTGAPSTSVPVQKAIAVNAATGRVIGIKPNAANGEIYRLDSTSGTPEWSLFRTFTPAQVSTNPGGNVVFTDGGMHMETIDWMTGDLYIIRRYFFGGAEEPNTCFMLYDDSGAGTMTALRGANGNAVLNGEASGHRFNMGFPDRQNQRMVWCIPQGDTTAHRGLDIYTSKFTDLLNWKKLYVKDAATKLLQYGNPGYDATGNSGLRPGFVANGFLYFVSSVNFVTPPWAVSSQGCVRIWRLPLY